MADQTAGLGIGHLHALGCLQKGTLLFYCSKQAGRTFAEEFFVLIIDERSS